MAQRTDTDYMYNEPYHLMTFVHRVTLILAAAILLGTPVPVCAQPLGLGATSIPGPLADLQHRLSTATLHSLWSIGIDIEDLATGFESGINADESMPAASIIKIPVMVEVFGQMEQGMLDLHKTLHVQSSDKDYGSGSLCDAWVGTPVNVEHLLWGMITDSDNTATNMLIRLVGRQHINTTMHRLGLRHTTLSADIRTDSGRIRYALRTSPHDMIKLLDAMAHRKLIDSWSSGQMLAILSGQHHNNLIPQSLPPGTTIAHKTGTLHDTLNDVGIVYLSDEPYAIAVMTTDLPDLESGRNFIRRVSRLAYDSFKAFAHWRISYGLPAFTSPDVAMWNSHSRETAAAPDAGIWKNPNFVP